MTAAALRRVTIDHPDTDGPRLRTMLSTASLTLQGMVRLALSIAVGRLAGPDALAQVTAGLAAASVLSLLWPSATGAAASRFIAAGQERHDPRALRQVTGHLGRRTLQASALLAPVGTLYWLLTQGNLAEALTIGALTIGLGGYAFVRGVHTGSRQIRRLIVWDLAASVSGVLGTVAVVASGVHSVLALLPLACGYLLITLAGWPPTAPERPQDAADMDHFVRWSTVGTVTSAGLIHMAMLVAHGRLTPADAGAFAAALNLVSPAALLANSFSMVLFPSVASAFARGDTEGALRQTRRATDGLVYVMVGIFGSLSLLAPWIVQLLWGENFALAAIIFPVLAVGPFARAVSVPAVTSLSSRDRHGVRHAGLSTMAGVVVAVTVWAVSPSTAWWGVAAGFSAAMTVTAVQNVVRASRRDHHPWWSAWLRTAAGVAGVGGLLLVREQFDFGLPLTIVTTVLGFAAWSALNINAVRRLFGMKA